MIVKGNIGRTPSRGLPHGDRLRGDCKAGFAMAATVVTVFVTAAMVSVMLTLASSNKQVADVLRHSSEAHYLAEGAVETAQRAVLAELAEWATPQASYMVEVGGVEVEVAVKPSGFE